MSTVELIFSQQNCYEYKIPSILLSSTFLVLIVLFIDSSSFCSWNLSVRNKNQQDCMNYKKMLTYTCRKHFPVLSSFITYHPVCNQINTTGVTSGAGIAYPFVAPESPWFLVELMLLDLYMYVLLIIVCPFGHCVVCSYTPFQKSKYIASICT